MFRAGSGARLLLRELNNVIELLAGGIHIRAVVNAHHYGILAVVCDYTEGMDIHAVCIFPIADIYEGIIDDLGMIELGELILADDLLIEQVVREGEVLAVDIHGVLREIKNSGVIEVGSVFIIGTALEKDTVFGEIVVSLEDYGADDTVELRLIYLMTLLSGLLEVLGLFRDLKIYIRGLGLLSRADDDDDNTDDADEEADESKNLNLAHEKSASDESEDRDDQSDDRISRDYRCGEVSEVSFNIHFLRGILSEWDFIWVYFIIATFFCQ